MTARLESEDVVVQAEAIPLALEFDDARMIAACTGRMVHNMSLMLPRSCGRLAHGVANSLGTAGRGECQIVPLLTTGIPARPEPRSFLIVFYGVHLHNLARSGNHVFVELYAIGMRIAPIHIRLSVIVNPYGGVDVIPVLGTPYERFPYRIRKGAVG